jgi:hypothetical protein
MATDHRPNDRRAASDRFAAVVSAAVLAARIAAAASDRRKQPRLDPPPKGREQDGQDGQVFQPHQHWNPRQRRAYAAFEIAYTTVDFGAALSFVIGSILFFYSDLQTEGTWMFLVGSILFALKPTIRLTRELVHVSLGKTSVVAKAMED